MSAITPYLLGIIAVLGITSIGWLIYQLMTAPLGYESHDGFHLGKDPRKGASK